MPRRKTRYRRRKKAQRRTNTSRQLTYNSAKKMSINRVIASLANKTYDFCRYSERLLQIESDVLSWQGGAMSFNLQEVAQYTDFTNMFDSYQICKVKVTFSPDIEQVTQLVGSTLPNDFIIPSFYVCRDHDNTVAPSDEATIASRSETIRVPATKPVTVSLVPQIGREIYRTAVSTAYETPYEVVWLDNVYADVPHYGLLYGMSATAGTINGPQFKYNIKTQYWIRCRGVR